MTELARRRPGGAGTNLLGLLALLATMVPACAETAGGNRAPAPAGSPITLSGERLGPITAGTPFSAVELRSLFPAATVTEATGATEGEPYRALRVAKGQTVLLELRSADGLRIHSVEIASGVRVGNLGVRHGDTYHQVYGAVASSDCAPGGVETASAAQPQHRPLPLRLEVGDVAAVKEDVRLALGRLEP